VDFSYLKHLSKGYDKNKILHDLMVVFGQDIWNFAFLLTHQHNLADDIRQDVFVKAYEKLDSFRGESSPKTWLLSITRNAAIDYRRSAFFRKVTLIDYVTVNGAHPSAEKEFFEKQVLTDAWKVVMSLPLKLREVIVLYVHHQLSIAEIADLLHVSESAVKVRLHRARNKVNEIYNGKDGELSEGI
jgi:RNA polymerase sigma-70 factor (ECF subfamily)